MLDSDKQPVKGMSWSFDSVTSVLDAVNKPSLMHWYYRTGIEGIVELMAKYGDKMPKDFESVKSLLGTEKLSPYSRKSAAGKSGTSIHGDLEKLCAGKKVVSRPENEGLLAWWDSRNLTKKDILLTEQPLVSFKYRVAGTPDVMYRDPLTHRVVLADLKTGKHIAWTHFVQGEAYRMMAAELTDLGTLCYPTVDDVSVLHVRPPGTEAGEDGWKELRAPEIKLDAFLAALTLYRSLPTKWSPEDMDEGTIV